MLELDAPSPGTVCTLRGTLGLGTLGTTAPLELDDDSCSLASAALAPLELDAPSPGSVCTDDDSSGLASALALFLASHLHLGSMMVLFFGSAFLR